MKTITRSLLAAGLLGFSLGAQANPETAIVKSTGIDGVEIDIYISIYKPDGANATNPAPVVLSSHGWGGQRTTSANAFGDYLAAGFGVVSISQRGHGESGGQANVEDPNYEGRDVMAVIDHIAQLEWVAGETGAGKVTPDGEKDPLLFSIGGSYGGGYQWAGMLSEMTQRSYSGDRTRFDAMSPGYTWYNLAQALAPNDVARTVYMSGLYAGKVRQGPETLADYVHQAYAYTMVTGTIPDGTVPGLFNLKEEFRKHGPAGYGEQGNVNIPIMVTQGSNDALFNLNQGYYTFERMLTPGALAKSVFIGTNGGHLDLVPGLTGVQFPAATNPSSGNVCKKEHFGAGNIDLAFFRAVLDDKNPRSAVGFDKPYNVASDTDICISSDALEQTTPFGVARLEIESVGSGVGSPAGVGIPIYEEIAGTEGLTISGIPRLSGNVYSAAADTRVFVALAKGTTPDDAEVIHNTYMPIRFVAPAGGGNIPLDQDFDVPLAGMAATLAPDEKLFLVLSAINPQFIGHGSRVPGAVVIGSAQVHLPVQ